MKKIIISLLLTAIVCGLSAYSILDNLQGNRVFAGDARILAMGSAGVSSFHQSGSVWLNPAVSAMLNEGFDAQLGSSFVFNGEDRSIPMYNFFDGYIDDANYVSNSSSYNDLSGRLNYRYQLNDFCLSANLGWYNTMDFNSEYKEQVRNDGNSDAGNSGDNSPDGYPPIIARNLRETEGSLGGLSSTLAFGWKDRVALGLSMQQLAGDWNHEMRIDWTDAAKELAEEELIDSKLTIDGEFDDEMMLTAGLAFAVNERLSIGFAMQPKVEFERTLQGEINGIAAEEVMYDTMTVAGVLDTLSYQDYIDLSYGKYVIPASYRLGFEYHPRNMWNTYFNFDIELVNCSEINEKFQDVTNYYLGVEHQINQKLPLRFGFNYKTDYYIFEGEEDNFAQKVSMPSFSAGTGFDIMNTLTLDLGMEYALRKYENIDLFGDAYYDREGLWNEMTPVDRGWENPDQVDESLITLQANITWKWQVK